ncbi:MAG: hypothetical protein HDT48_07075 [Ruminococcaceae bacterium]|nr:hypothetical protein [Oscillospiraceae bacterium]
MVTAKICGEDGVLSYLGTVGGAISRSKYRISDIYEIRLRAGQRVVLETARGRAVIDRTVSAEEIGECIKCFCNYSLHSFEKELKEGFITLKGGHRAGFCGTAVIKNGAFEGIKDISSINIRVAREIIGAGDFLRSVVFDEDFNGLLICGRPMSGKTTVLRDLCRIIGDKYKLALVDERGEIAAVYGGVPQNNVGAYTDVLNGYGKAEGIDIATKTLSPEYIACDEITGFESCAKLCLNSGVKMIFTLHCGSIERAKETEIVKTGAISHIAFLGGKIGQITERLAVR